MTLPRQLVAFYQDFDIGPAEIKGRVLTVEEVWDRLNRTLSEAMDSLQVLSTHKTKANAIEEWRRQNKHNQGDVALSIHFIGVYDRNTYISKRGSAWYVLERQG